MTRAQTITSRLGPPSSCTPPRPHLLQNTLWLCLSSNSRRQKQESHLQPQEYVNEHLCCRLAWQARTTTFVPYDNNNTAHDVSSDERGLYAIQPTTGLLEQQPRWRRRTAHQPQHRRLERAGIPRSWMDRRHCCSQALLQPTNTHYRRRRILHSPITRLWRRCAAFRQCGRARWNDHRAQRVGGHNQHKYSQ